jgi:hypothetical protein
VIEKGTWKYGERKVLSTRKRMLCFFAIDAVWAISTTLRSGFVGVSNHKSCSHKSCSCVSLTGRSQKNMSKSATVRYCGCVCVWYCVSVRKDLGFRCDCFF